MHKNLEQELKRLAEAILQTENFNNSSDLHQKSREIYEKLSAIIYIDKFLNSEEKPENSIENTEVFSDEIHHEIEKAIKEELEIVEEDILEITQDKVEDIFSLDKQFIKKEEVDIPVEETTANEKKEEKVDLFSTIEEDSTQKISLNDKLLKNAIQIGLNDRIAFVKHLFDGSQEEFNRVLSQLNSFNTEEEAKSFIKKIVKPDYNWEDKTEFEERLNALIERKFL